MRFNINQTYKKAGQVARIWIVPRKSMLYNNRTDEFTRRMVKGSFWAVNRFSSTFFVNRSAFTPMNHARNGAGYA